jgi:hypothetical protein
MDGRETQKSLPRPLRHTDALRSRVRYDVHLGDQPSPRCHKERVCCGNSEVSVLQRCSTPGRVRCRVEVDGQRIDVVEDPLHDGTRDRERGDGQNGRRTLATVLAAGGSSDVHDNPRPAPRPP